MTASYQEEDYTPLSALQHFIFCPRQCGLIHLEQVWEENRLTAEGKLIHRRPDSLDRERRAGCRVVYGLPLHSRRMGLSGKADAVEFHPDEKSGWRPYPVEYKRGKPKHIQCDEVQLCAQAMCLEEMMEIKIGEGALFYSSMKEGNSQDPEEAFSFDQKI